MPVDHAKGVERLGARLDLHRALERLHGLGQAIGALEHERQVVARERMSRVQFQGAAERRDRGIDILFGFGKAQGEVAVRILRRFGQERFRPRHRLLAVASLHQRQNEVVGRLSEPGPFGERTAERIDRGVERADAVERLSECVLDIGIVGGNARGVPESPSAAE